MALSPSHMPVRLRVLLAIVAVLAGVQYLLVPLVRWQARTVAEAKELQGAIARKKRFTGTGAKMTESYHQSVQVRDTLRRHFPAGPSDPRSLQLALQQQMEKWTKNFDIRIKNVDWLPIGKEALIRAPVRFQLEAVPDNLMQLLYSLETAPLLYTVEGIRISVAGNKSPAVKAELEVCAYGVAGEPRL